MSAARDALAKLREARELVRAAAEALDRSESLLDAAASTAEHPVQHPVADLPAPCAHRPGRPAKLDTDAELRAFILARIDALTFPQLEEAVAKAFPPDRRIGKSAINDWWLKHRAALAAKSQPE